VRVGRRTPRGLSAAGEAGPQSILAPGKESPYL
jgi:hypothetical protein